MDEKTKFAAELAQTAEKDVGRALTGQEKTKLDEFAESLLLLLDDTGE